MRALTALLLASAALLGALFAAPLPAAAGPQRVVSLNACTDQLLMLLVAPRRIAALSYLAVDPQVSAMAAAARAYPRTHGQLEAVLELRPDLVLAGSYSTRTTVFGLKRLGVPVLEMTAARDFDGIRANLRRLGAALEVPARAEELIAAFDARLAELKPDAGAAPPPLAAIYAANGWSAGPGHLRHAVLEAAGLRNLASTAKVDKRSQLPLEVLVAAQPDLVITPASPPQAPALAEALLAHPAFRSLEARARFVGMPNALWSCGTPLIAQAVARLAAATASGGGQP